MQNIALPFSFVFRVPDIVLDDSSLAHIMEMGFSAEMARNALIITRGDVPEAINLLLSSPDR